MELIRMPAGGPALIQGYGEGGFRVAGQRIEGAVLVAGDSASALDILTIEEIGVAQAARITALDPLPELLLIGAGAGPQVLAAPVRAALAAAGIGVEVMGTGAACRTFNLLVGEGRRVAALLIPIA